MPGRTIAFGQFGAHGIKGSRALAARLDQLAGGIASPITTPRGLAARLRELTATPAGYAAMDTAGITATPRTLMKWLAEETVPNSRNLTRIEAAYTARHRHKAAEHLLRRLNADGGTRVELYPLDQRGVADPRRRQVPPRSFNVRRWDAIVAAWAQQDFDRLDEAWEDQYSEIGSQWGSYEFVTGIGFAA
jgi:hypothetical protein